MVKAKEFWKVLCEDFNYRFFSGVAHSGFKVLYKAMTGDIMHYVPATDEIIALGLVSGAYISGHKGAIIINTKFVPDLYRLIEFNNKFGIPVLIIGYTDTGNYDNVGTSKRIKTIKDMSKFLSKPELDKGPAMMVFGKGDLN